MDLGINIDHVATLRQARGTAYPDPIEAVRICESSGADLITLHLREDRRHIQDDDVSRVREVITTRMNLEMAVTAEMAEIARNIQPEDVCLVPEKREERTTEGGLDAAGLHNQLAPIVWKLADNGIRVSLFIEASERQLEAAQLLRVPVVEFHTGEYAHAGLDNDEEREARELERIATMSKMARQMGIEPHAGHGLTYENVKPVAAIPELAELNIGHYLVGEAVFVGLETAVRRMRDLMDEARS